MTSAAVQPIDEAMLGSTISVVTQLGEPIEGTVFAYDSVSKLLVLEQLPNNAEGKATCRMLNAAALKELRVVLAAPEANRSGRGMVDKIPLPAVDNTAIRQREKRAMEKAIEDASFVGKGVTTRAQLIFDTLRKTMPCAWAGQDILVLNDIRISPPYNAAACNGKGPALNRVKKVLTGELEKLGLN